LNFLPSKNVIEAQGLATPLSNVSVFLPIFGGLEMVASPQAIAGMLAYKIPRIKLALVHEGLTAGKLHYIHNPEDAEEFLQPLCHAPEEHFVSLHLNTRNEIIGLHEVSHGTLDASLVHPREIFKAALLANSHSIIVCHNHPSGAIVVPSKEDLLLTRQLIRASKLLNVGLLDHLIISPNQPVYSIRTHHSGLWKAF